MQPIRPIKAILIAVTYYANRTVGTVDTPLHAWVCFAFKSNHNPSRTWSCKLTKLLTLNWCKPMRVFCTYTRWISVNIYEADQAKLSKHALCIAILMYHITPCLSEYQSYRGLSVVSCRMFRNGLNISRSECSAKLIPKGVRPPAEMSVRVRNVDVGCEIFFWYISPGSMTILANYNPISKTEPRWCRPTLRPFSSFFPYPRNTRLSLGANFAESSGSARGAAIVHQQKACQLVAEIPRRTILNTINLSLH